MKVGVQEGEQARRSQLVWWVSNIFAVGGARVKSQGNQSLSVVQAPLHLF